jgi:hypothetical protein
MPTPWFRRVKQAGELTVFNNGGTWSSDVEKALATFNGLGFPVKLVKTTDEKNALIKVKLAMGPDSVSSWGNTVSTKSDFDPSFLHGLTVPLTEIHERKRTFEIIFAGIFLPGKAEATSRQREVIVVHEFIHACGLDEGQTDGSKDAKGQDHDVVGIMFPQMKTQGDGLIEYLAEKDAAPMTPIRVGSQTRCKIQMIWGTEACRND